MSDHETWLNDQDKTAQWPTTPPYGLGSSEGEHTEPLGVVSNDELSAPNFAPQAEGTAVEAQAAPAQPGTTPVAEETASGPALTVSNRPTVNRLRANPLMASNRLTANRPTASNRLTANLRTASNRLTASHRMASHRTGNPLTVSLLTGNRHTASNHQPAGPRGRRAGPEASGPPLPSWS
jgi:hypothetical protein